jgi:hypothetical protein
MTSISFRPVEFWKSSFMTMQENSFFELMRSVFGKIKTPYNKHQLINDLEVFLLRDDIQKNIASYIDQNDIKIITAVAIFNEPSQEELAAFFEGEINYVQLQDIIVNLEERFILYRFNDENTRPKPKVSRLALNPVLGQTLLLFTEDISSLFPDIPVKAKDPCLSPETKVIVNDCILAGLYSFVSRNKLFFRAEGVIRKRIIKEGKSYFPDIDLSFLLGSLQILGLFFTDADSLVPDKKYFADFSSLSKQERSEYCAAALLIYGELNSPLEILPPLYKNKIHETANFIHCFLDSFKADYLYPLQSLKRLIEIIKQRTGVTLKSNKLLEVLVNTGLLTTEYSQYKQIDYAAYNTSNKINGSPLIAIDSGSSVLVYPEIDFTDALKIAAFANIQETRFSKEAGDVVRFEIDKDSVVAAFDTNINADEIIKLLKRLSNNRVDEALIWNLKDWEKRYNEVSLKKGVVLTLSHDRRYLAETTQLANLIRETLAPGLYLLHENAMDRAAAALQSAGIDIISRRNEKTASVETAYKYFSPLSSGPTQKKILPTPDKDRTGTFKHKPADTALSETFRKILKKIPIDKTMQAELSARIDRRLILCESQLKEADIRYEKLEARHLDYSGKQNIAKQAIAQHSPVEIVTGSAEKRKSIMGIPESLEKENDELVLVINSADEDELMRIPLAKISLLRRIKKSIFEY